MPGLEEIVIAAAAIVTAAVAGRVAFQRGRERGRMRGFRTSFETYLMTALPERSEQQICAQTLEWLDKTQRQLELFPSKIRVEELQRIRLYLSERRVHFEQATRKKRAPKRSFTRGWDLAGLLFDRKTRADVYEPVINEIREDFLIARRNCVSKANFRWVELCFRLRGSLAFIRCVRISLLRPLVALIPSRLKQLWKLFS
ncbi:MAG: hypothetical protein QOI07_2621 [Verrucomicrobiota bacterium]|jgi:hypothetical protein